MLLLEEKIHLLKKNPRAVAAMAIAEAIDQKKSLSLILSLMVKEDFNHKDLSLLKELCYGVFRWFPRLKAMARFFIKKPIKTKNFDIYVLIMIGLYQIEFLRIPDHACVFETAKAAEDLGKSWAKEMINAVLRNYLRHKENCKKEIDKIPSAFYAHPDELLESLKKNWPNDWEDIVKSNNAYPPMVVRVNTRKISRDRYLEKLKEMNIMASPCRYAALGIIIEPACDIMSLPGYKEGEISMQDGAAQLAAELLLLSPGQRVLDACAAPGGKTTHMLELEPELSQVIAIDNKKNRLDKIKENLDRLQLNAELVFCDVNNVEAWWDGVFFDRILLDAPCSATGVIRRRPDVKIINRHFPIQSWEIYDVVMNSLQLELMNSLWPLLKPGGVLLYATCSILPEENALLVEQFLKDHQDAYEDVIHAEWGLPQKIGRQILPGGEMDGFFYARLRKK